MTTKEQGGPQRGTRAHPILFSEWEEDTFEAQVGDMELAAGTPEEAVMDLFHEENVLGPETEPVVRLKTGKVSTPRDGAESFPVGQDFLLEIRQFMKHQQRNKNILFDELIRGSVEQISQFTHHHPLPTSRTIPQSLGGGTLLSELSHAQPQDHVPLMSPPLIASFRHYHEPQIPDFVEGE